MSAVWEPYADGSSGQQWDGSEAGEADRRSYILPALTAVMMAKGHGITSEEWRRIIQPGHGTASGSLSNLHRSGTIALLKEKRGDYHIYVMPGYVDGRPTKPYTKNKDCTCPDCPEHFEVPNMTPRLMDVLWAVAVAGGLGITSPEHEEETGKHHGEASGSFSSLHAMGEIARLREKRGPRRSHGVYVMPYEVRGRPTAPYAEKQRAKPCKCPHCTTHNPPPPPPPPEPITLF